MQEKIRQVMMEITGLAFDVTKTTKHEVFIYYSAHVNAFTIRIYHNGWVNEEELYRDWGKYKEKQMKAEEKYTPWINYKSKYKNESHEAYLTNRDGLKRLIEIKQILLSLLNKGDSNANT